MAPQWKGWELRLKSGTVHRTEGGTTGDGNDYREGFKKVWNKAGRPKPWEIKSVTRISPHLDEFPVLWWTFRIGEIQTLEKLQEGPLPPPPPSPLTSIDRLRKFMRGKDIRYIRGQD